MYPQSMFSAKIRKISFFFSAEIFQFLKLKNLFIARASFGNVLSAFSWNIMVLLISLSFYH